jgi:hypothetical protein
LSIERTGEVFKEIIDEKGPKEQKELLSAIGGPSASIRDQLWLIVVIAFGLVLVGSFLTLAVGVFYKEKTSPELILTMFTSVVGFLAGLFVPSPIANRRD